MSAQGGWIHLPGIRKPGVGLMDATKNRGRILRPLAVAFIVIAVVASALVGFLYDGSGQGNVRVWTRVNVISAALVVTLLAVIRSGRISSARVASGALALIMGLVSVAASIYALPSPPISPEGLWLWPLMLSSFTCALLAAVYAIRGPKGSR